MQSIAWQEHLQETVLGNTLEAWAYAALIALLTLLLLSRAKLHLSTRLSKPDSRRERWALVLALLQRTRWIFFLAVAIYLASQELTLSQKERRGVEIAVIIGVWFQVGLWASAVIVQVLRSQLERRGATQLMFAGGFTVFSFMAQALVWFVAVTLALANAGVNIIAIVAGLGTGGAALALATRSMLANLFANATITFDKLFFIGDTLVTSGFEGKVEHIGNRTTHLRSPNGELILISNADLLKSRLRNFGRVEERREVFTVRVDRSASAREVRTALALVERAIRDQATARFERCHFALITPDALQLEAVYYVSTGATTTLPELRDYMNAQIHSAFATHRIAMAYATQRFEPAFA